MLGKRRILDLLPTTSKRCLRQKSPMREAVRMFKEFKRMEVVPIVDENECPLGGVRRSHVFESLIDGISPETPVYEIMEPNFGKVRMTWVKSLSITQATII